jgi:hypothetical protein
MGPASAALRRGGDSGTVAHSFGEVRESSVRRRTGLRHRLVIGGAAFAALVVAFAATAQEGSQGIELQTARLWVDQGRGRILVKVTNQNRQTVDVDVLCEFMKNNTTVMHASGTVVRLPPRRSDTLEVSTSRSQPFDSARCRVEKVQP